MPNFEYQIKTKAGETKTGVMESPDLRAARAELLQEGHFILRLHRQGESGRVVKNPVSSVTKAVINPIVSGATAFELAVFFRQFSTLLKSGISLVQALRLLSDQGESPRIRKAASETANRLEQGGSLSESFARYPWIFSGLHINILKAGEMTGDLEGSTSRIAHYLEWENSLRQKVKVATIYPKILIVAVIFLPKLYVAITESFESYIRQTGVVALEIGLGVLALWMGYRWANQIPSIRRVLDMLKLSVPKIGGMMKMLALSKFYRSFASMYTAGVPLHQGLKSAAESVGNTYLTSRLVTAIPRLDSGYSLVDCLVHTGVLPSIAVDMLRTGKATGNVDEMLNKLAEYTENEAEVQVLQTTVILGVFLLLIIGGYIGHTVVEFYVGHVPKL